MDKNAKLEIIKAKKQRQAQSEQNQKELLELVHAAVKAIHTLPDEIKARMPEEKHDDQTVTVANIGELEKHLQEISAKIKQPDIKIDTDLTEITKLFERTQQQLKKIENKDINVLVNKEIEFPRRPEDAIPVVLVDRDRKAFYEAARRMASGSAGPSVKLLEQSLQSIDAKTLPADSFRIDAFGRERVSEPHTIFDSKMVTDDQPLFYDEIINGTATAEFIPGDAAVNMTVLADGDYAIRQTFMRFDYQPAKSQRIFLTGILGAPVLNTESRIGYFNTDFTAPYTGSRDGLYFGVDGTELYVAISHNGVENRIPQSEWNVDKLDGTGESGITIDLESVQIFTMDFEWLGVGRVRYGFVIDGLIYYCHYENHANVAGETTVYMSSPNHSVRYEVYSTGGEKHIKHICASVQSEGGVEPSGVTRSISRGISTVARTTDLGGLIFFRLKQTSACTTVAPDNFSTLCTSNNAANYRYSMILNPTIAGDALTWIPVANSAIEYALASANNLVSNGEELITGYASGDTPGVFLSTQLIINPGISLNGTQDIFCLAVQTTGGSDNFVGSINLREITCG